MALVEGHHIKPHNIWNFDEKGILIGICQATKRIVPIKTLLNGFIKGSLQDGSREFITILAAVNAIGIAIPPSLLYASNSGDLQDSWLEDFDDCRQFAYFGTSKKGWTSDELGLAWLDRFHEATHEIAGYQKRLLILDGHSSHVNMAFVTKAIDFNILIVVFPPHSTHRLQPLDVSVFSPLANYYSQGLDEMITSSRGFSRMSKRLFWSIFWPAWQKAVRYETISSGFEKTGIYPFNPVVVLDQLKPTTAFSSSDDSEIDPEPITNARDVRQLIKSVRQEKGVISSKMDLLCKSMEAMVFENDLLRHENTQIHQTLLNEVKRRKRGKPMGLLGANEPKFGQFWSPTKLAIRKQEIETQAQQEERQKQLAADQRLQSQIERDLKTQAYRDRVEFNKRERDRKKAEKDAEIERKRRQKELEKAQKAYEKQSTLPSRLRTKSQKKSQQAIKAIPIRNEVSEQSVLITRSGRITTLPAHFQK